MHYFNGKNGFAFVVWWLDKDRNFTFEYHKKYKTAYVKWQQLMIEKLRPQIWRQVNVIETEVEGKELN